MQALTTLADNLSAPGPLTTLQAWQAPHMASESAARQADVRTEAPALRQSGSGRDPGCESSVLELGMSQHSAGAQGAGTPHEGAHSDAAQPLKVAPSYELKAGVLPSRQPVIPHSSDEVLSVADEVLHGPASFPANSTGITDITVIDSSRACALDRTLSLCLLSVSVSIDSLPVALHAVAIAGMLRCSSATPTSCRLFCICQHGQQ